MFAAATAKSSRSGRTASVHPGCPAGSSVASGSDAVAKPVTPATSATAGTPTLRVRNTPPSHGSWRTVSVLAPPVLLQPLASAAADAGQVVPSRRGTVPAPHQR